MQLIRSRRIRALAAEVAVAVSQNETGTHTGAVIVRQVDVVDQLHQHRHRIRCPLHPWSVDAVEQHRARKPGRHVGLHVAAPARLGCSGSSSRKRSGVLRPSVETSARPVAGGAVPKPVFCIAPAGAAPDPGFIATTAMRDSGTGGGGGIDGCCGWPDPGGAAAPGENTGVPEAVAMGGGALRWKRDSLRSLRSRSMRSTRSAISRCLASASRSCLRINSTSAWNAERNASRPDCQGRSR
jgi:hypothetical protein